MRSANQVDIILFEELLDDNFTESVADTTIVVTPRGLALLWVGPEEIAEEAVLWHLGGSRNLM